MKLALKEKIWIGTFVGLWLIVSSVSTIHSVEFFKLSNNEIMSWFLASAFELGAIACLGGLVISRGSKLLIWCMLCMLTAFQIHCNMYWCWVNAEDLTSWIKLLSIVDEDPDVQLRIFAVISGGILPVLALGFTKSLMDYLNPASLEEVDIIKNAFDTIPEENQNDVNATVDSIETEHEKLFREMVESGEATPEELLGVLFTDEEIAENNRTREEQHLKNVIESQDTYEEYIHVKVKEDDSISDEEFDDLIKNYPVDEEVQDQEDYYSSTKQFLEEIETNNESKLGWDEVLNNDSIPFWSKLDKDKTLKVLKDNDLKIINELPKGNKK